MPRVRESLGRLREDHLLAKELESIEDVVGIRLEELTPFYVSPLGQNSPPADDPDDHFGSLTVRESVFRALERFLGGGPMQASHAVILSDAGMGKSSLLAMLKLAQLSGLVATDLHVVLRKISKHAVASLSSMLRKERTILLLDSLDEDPAAWRRFDNHLQKILQQTSKFHRVIITCRTQFLPVAMEEGGRSESEVRIGGFHCRRLYLSPFEEEQVDEYLARRFGDEQEAVRARAHAVIRQIHSLRFRPMVLAYVEYLLEGNHDLQSGYDVYDAITSEWMSREVRKGNVDAIDPFLEACTEIALQVYRGPESLNDELSTARIKGICRPFLASVRYFEVEAVEGRSLLTRTSSGFRFAHLTIAEFLIARKALEDPERIEGWELTDLISRFILEKLPARGARIGGLVLRGFCGPGSSWKDLWALGARLPAADAVACSFEGADFTNADLARGRWRDSSLERCSLRGASLLDSVFHEVELKEVDLSATRLDGSVLDRCELRGVNLRDASLAGGMIVGCLLVSVDLCGTDLRDCDLPSELPRLCTVDLRTRVDDGPWQEMLYGAQVASMQALEEAARSGAYRSREGVAPVWEGFAAGLQDLKRKAARTRKHFRNAGSPPGEGAIGLAPLMLPVMRRCIEHCLCRDGDVVEIVFRPGALGTDWQSIVAGLESPSDD